MRGAEEDPVMPNAKGKSHYFAFVAEALCADEKLRPQIEQQSVALIEAVEVARSRLSLADTSAQALAKKVGIGALRYGAGDPVGDAVVRYDDVVAALDAYWNGGDCDLDGLSLDRLPADWPENIESAVTTALDLLQEIEAALDGFPAGCRKTLEECKVQLVEFDTLEPAASHHAAETLLAQRTHAWSELTAGGTVALADLKRFCTHADMKKLRRQIKAAEKEQRELCEQVHRQREQAEAERREREARRQREEEESRRRAKREWQEAEQAREEAERAREEAERRARQDEERAREQEAARRARKQAAAERSREKAERRREQEAIQRAEAERERAALEAAAAKAEKRKAFWEKVLGGLLAAAVAAGVRFYSDDKKSPAPAQSPKAAAYSPNPAWLTNSLYGSDNGYASLRRVTITDRGGYYEAYITNQFSFTCRIDFDAKGDPARLSRCRSADRWTASPDTIVLTCSTNGTERVCQGTYTLASPDGFTDAARMTIARKR